MKQPLTVQTVQTDSGDAGVRTPSNRVGLDESAARKATPSIRWRCDACGATGALPSFDGVPIEVVRDAISSAHARNASSCELANGVLAVLAERDGRKIRFGKFGPVDVTDLPAPIPVPAAELIARAESSLAFARERKFVKAALMTDDLDALISLAKSALLELPR